MKDVLMGELLIYVNTLPGTSRQNRHYERGGACPYDETKRTFFFPTQQIRQTNPYGGWRVKTRQIHYFSVPAKLHKSEATEERSGTGPTGGQVYKRIQNKEEIRPAP